LEKPSGFAPRRARLFRNGRNQAIRIPREFELPGEEVIGSREEDCLVIEPVRKKPGPVQNWLVADPLFNCQLLLNYPFERSDFYELTRR
jgi:virulence-associated protein VagC